MSERNQHVHARADVEAVPVFEITLGDGVSGCRMMNDGRLETFGSYVPDACAETFWHCVRDHLMNDPPRWPVVPAAIGAAATGETERG